VPALTITPAGAAARLSLSTFATGFPSLDAGGGTSKGPIGVAFPNDGAVLATDANHKVYRFPSDVDGQVASDNLVCCNYTPQSADALAQIGSTIYMGDAAIGDIVVLFPLSDCLPFRHEFTLSPFPANACRGAGPSGAG
jgi:hypothetical protein